ncbi:MAG: TIGR00341 family protein [Promethearchaeota archaeon]
MRKLSITIPTEDTKKLVEILKETDYDFSIIEGKDTNLITMAVHPDDVGSLITDLQKEGIGRVTGTLYVSAVELVLPYKLHKMKTEGASRIAIEELYRDVEEGSKLNRNYIIFIVLSAILSSLGLLNNNVVAVIASMVIAPLMGPIIGTSLGTVLSDKKLFKEGLKAEVLGLVLSIAVGFIMGYAYPEADVTTEILLRASPTIFDVGLAIVSGSAAALCFTSGIATALVGIAIAAALMPPACNVGLGVALQRYDIALGSAILLLTNIFSINITALVIFWLKDVKPTLSLRRKKLAKGLARKRGLLVVIAILVLCLPIGATTYNALVQNSVNRTTTKVVEEEIAKISGAEIEEIDNVLNLQRRTLFVEVKVDSEIPIGVEVAKIIAERITQETGFVTTVEIRTFLVQSVRYEPP